MSLWPSRHAATIDPDRFRAHDQYLEQSASYPYHELTKWARIHRPDWLDAMTEDGAFGCTRATSAEGKTVSRDLLDSICELDFLDRNVPNLGESRVLDIGAGYGRLAHRLLTVHPDAFVYCTDPIPVSRLVCEKYVAHRGLRRAMVVRPEEVPQLLAIDLAVNVHSWSECSLDEVRWWLDAIGVQMIPMLFIVPHTPTLGTWSDERGGGNGPSYMPELEARGWRIAAEWGGPPCCPRAYYLFERGVT
jgi:putative sugar O-methyltransferase